MKKLGKKVKALQLVLAMFLAIGVIFAFGTSTKAATPKVTGVKQTYASNSQVKVSWDTVFWSEGGWLYGRISASPQMDNCTERLAGGDRQTEFYFNGLNPGKTYYVQIGSSDALRSSGNAPENTVWSDVVEVVTAPDKVNGTNIQYVGATETSITVSWAAVEGATSYRILIYKDTNENGFTVTSNTNSATITGLEKNTEYNIRVWSEKSNSSNTFTADAGQYNYAVKHELPTLPTKVTGLDCDYFDMSVKKGRATFSCDKNAVADGYQYEIYKYNGKKALIKGEVGSGYYGSIDVTNSKLKTRQIYKIRVRAYVNKSNNEKAYGAWSSYDYFSRMAGQDVSLKKNGSNKIRTSWKKVTGATSYTIYLGTTSAYSSSNVKYKKVGTTQKTTYDIKTKIKNNKYYYVRVIPNYKKGKTTYAGTVNSTSSRSAYGYMVSGKRWYYYN